MSGGSFDAIITNGMAAIRGATDAAARKVGIFREHLGDLGTSGELQFKRIGEAITKMGGPLAQISGRFFGAMGMSEGMGKLTLAAIAAGIALKMMASSMQLVEKRAQAFAAVASDMRQIAKDARSAELSFASGSEGIGRLQAKAESVYAPDAGKVADLYATRFGVTKQDALTAMGNVARIPKANRASALVTAATVAQTSEYSMAEAVDRMSDRATLNRVLHASTKQFGGRLPVKDYMAAELLQLMRGTQGTEAKTDALAAVTGNKGGPASWRTPGINQAENITQTAQLRAFVYGKTELAMRGQAAAIINPLAASLLEWNTKQQEAIQKLLDTSKAAGGVIERLKDLGRGFGGEGSYATQAERAQTAMGDGIMGTGGN